MRITYLKFRDHISFRNNHSYKISGSKILKKGNNYKISYDFFLQFFIKYSIYHPLSADTSFKFLAVILFGYGIYKFHSFVCFTREDNSGKTKNTHQLFFHEESIHEVSRRFIDSHTYIHTYIHYIHTYITYIHTYIRTTRNQYVPTFFHKKAIKMKNYQ